MNTAILAQKIKKVIAGPKKITKLIEKLADQIIKKQPLLEKVVLIGIQTGGAPLANRLKKFIFEKTGVDLPVGYLDITLYRDDWTRITNYPEVKRTEIPFSIEDKIVVLVDDVIYTGRTVRAAMDALIDIGRPKKIELAVLVDRGGRDFPIEPTYKVFTVKNIGFNEYVSVYFSETHGKDQIVLEVYE
ncbi:bifunctional pyr operon transcriptional regulator/uracil phosphoribosyltransferase PyrR [Thermodesulfobacterium sp. TA1]|uniref:bifunctional pyr operon transcriptional regulator/uracil phosphoribosyltransferase PyrR n=1 Tax=Thermodesulfobacterium sp. TA1 TaxID=2234087 RepID=UPI001231A453|nr:bifunctional pyr operon transcriptional regulator/uracil phosphoribosyltransferase PyrR [Thermodesulfobacterium sp. TA1]QER42897.1 bifunctional pyr operon transcriptional regulator/uracil phosphoribosyltransferase PyrR [Thermodesulfobacterium sp. TA1]